LRIVLWTAAGLVLLLPLVAMQVTDEVFWDGTDFAILAAMLAGVGIGLELAVRKTTTPAYRMAALLALVSAFILVGVSLGVGIFGTPDRVEILMVAGVLAVGVIGALVTRFRPRGMAMALLATAIAMVVMGVAGLAAGMHTRNWEVVLCVVFAALFVGSAKLFRRAASGPED
jgi:hypothetical protein